MCRDGTNQLKKQFLCKAESIFELLQHFMVSYKLSNYNFSMCLFLFKNFNQFFLATPIAHQSWPSKYVTMLINSGWNRSCNLGCSRLLVQIKEAQKLVQLSGV